MVEHDILLSAAGGGGVTATGLWYFLKKQFARIDDAENDRKEQAKLIVSLQEKVEAQGNTIAKRDEATTKIAVLETKAADQERRWVQHEKDDDHAHKRLENAMQDMNGTLKAVSSDVVEIKVSVAKLQEAK